MTDARKTRRLYHNLGYVTVFTYFRFFHAPYSLVEALTPKKGKIIDLGAGYGFFSNLLGLASPEREVLGVELSERKLQYADKGIKNVRFINKDITRLEIDDCDAVILFHVLHHLHSHAQQHRLLKEVCKKLKKGGRLIVVEIDLRPLWKFLFTVVIDATLYIGNWFYYRSERQFLELFNRLGLTTEEIVPAHRFVPLSHKVYICRK